MAKARKKRVSAHDAARLGLLLRHQEVTLKGGVSGTIVDVTKGGIQVRNHNTGKLMPFQLFDAIMHGGMTIGDPKLEHKVKSILRTYLPSSTSTKVNNTSRSSSVDAAMPKTDNPQNKKAEKGLGLKDTGGGDIDVVSNVKLACFLNNITEEACATHLHGLGLDGFSISLEAGLEGGHRYLALRECSSFLDCDINVLLATPRENIVRILTVCGRDSWKLAEQKAYSAQSNTTSIVLATHGMLTFENGDKGIRRIAIDALRHAANGPCYAIACKLGMWHAPHYSFSELLLSVTDPGEEADHLFTTLCTHNGNMPPSGFATTAYTEGPTFPANPGQKKNQKPKATPIHVNQFPVRRTFGSHRTNGHSQQPILASVSIIPKKGNRPKAVEFDAFWCPKCGKYFMDERTYLKLKKDGYICCKVIEEKDLLSRQAGTGFYDGLAPESIVHMYGYNVNQQKNLSVAERQMILSFVIENQIQTDQEVAHLLEWLISQHESKPNLTRAVERWRSDLYFVRRHQSPTRKVRVDAIYAKI